MSNTSTPQKISILGAGILGLTCADMLAKRFGQDSIRIYDSANFPAQNASFLAGGMIAPYSELDHMPTSFLAAGQAGIAHWKTLSACANTDFEFGQKGSLLLAHESDRHLLERFESILPDSQDWQKINRNAILKLEPSLTPTKFAQGIFIEGEAHLHPQKLMAHLCASIMNKHTEEKSPEEESRIADWVIDCRGMGAGKDNPDLRGVKGEILIVRNTEFHLDRPIRLMHPRYPLYIIPRADNVFMIGATIIESSEKDSVSLRSGLELMSAAFSLHPSFADAEILSVQSGIRPAYPDNLPRIYVKNNIIRCNGLYRHGYLLSPTMAQCVTALVTDEKFEFMDMFLKENRDEHYSERKTARG